MPSFALLTDLLVAGSPFWILVGLFAIWMLVDAVRRGEWLWVVFIFLFPPLNAPLYYFLVYRQSSGEMRGFELPGAADRRRIKELQDQIHHLDKAHHHAQLGDIYFQQGKLDKAEACYRAALEREAEDLDTLAHLGHCLLRQGRAGEALPLLEQVAAKDPAHDFGHTRMALAETYAALGRPDDAVAVWKEVLERHTYARARVQLAELYLARGQADLARQELDAVIHDDAHTPEFQRKQERVWVQRARKLRRDLG